MRRILVLFAVGLAVIAPGVFAADSYQIDPVHSSLGFSITHMMVSQVTGQFNQYEGMVVYDPDDLAHSSVTVIVQAFSINTNSQRRDQHLRNRDFFNVEEFPTLTFVSKSITPSSITGNLTIRGVMKEISVPVTISGPVKNPSGSMVLGISGSFKINRQDYGIQWNKVLDQGGVVLSDEVIINVNIEAQKKEVSEAIAGK